MFVHSNVQTQQHTNVGAFIQANVSTDIQPVKQTIQSDLGLSSVLGLFTPDIPNQEQTLMKRKKKKPKRGLG